MLCAVSYKRSPRCSASASLVFCWPTGRRATCTGWVSSIARIAYVAGPALAAVLLKVFPTMTGFWVVAGLVILIPIGIVWLVDPGETTRRDLEEIALLR